MHNNIIVKIIIGLLVILVINSIIGWFIPKGISYDQLETEIKLHDLEQQKAIWTDENDRLQFKIKSFKYEILQNDSIVDNADIHGLDSMFTDYFGG